MHELSSFTYDVNNDTNYNHKYFGLQDCPSIIHEDFVYCYIHVLSETIC